MIEVSTAYIDGETRIKHIRLVPPFEYRYGVLVEQVSVSLIRGSFVKSLLTTLGFREVCYDDARRAFLYTRNPFGVWQYQAINRIIILYWALLWFVYKHFRMFQYIPAYERFSWRYFTPYYCYQYVWRCIAQWGKTKSLLLRLRL